LKNQPGAPKPGRRAFLKTDKPPDFKNIIAEKT
jgi:hypothetical protein